MLEPSASGDWEKDVMQKMLFASLTEQRRQRRWGIFFKVLIFAYIILMTVMFWPKSTKPFPATHTALVDLSGMINEDEASLVLSGLRDAFEAPQAKGIIIRINCPGGSSVHSGYLYDEIVRLRKIHQDKLVYAVVTDLAASGGYYVASAADYIYAYPTSLVGNIGALMPLFGFVGTMEHLGIEQRSITSGENKLFLDPFAPENTKQREFAQKMLDDVHNTFIQAVKEGRGDRLKASPDVFSGLIWTGQQALELGLVDGLGSPGFVARELIGAEDVVNYTPSPSLLDRFANRAGASVSNQLMTHLSLRPTGVQ